MRRPLQSEHEQHGLIALFAQFRREIVAALGDVTDAGQDGDVLLAARFGFPALFVGFTATTAESDFPRSCIIGFGSSPSRCGPEQRAL